MRMSVIVRSKDEADRLRLALASLERQSTPAEVIVVDDGSTDHTPEVLAAAARRMPLTAVTHALARGRSGAANAGAQAATGDVLVFMDGDTLAGPELVARHAALHATGIARVGRGETFHLRCTRSMLDPETGTPRPGEEAHLARLAPDELARSTVRRAEIVGDFAAIVRRAEPGIYPGAGPRRLHELEIDALRRHPDCGVLWAAASGSNLSVRRDAFLRCGGFDESIDINEHRELALRLCEAGARMAIVDGAHTFHLTHRAGWRNPLVDTHWEERFYRAHPRLEVKLLAVFWAGLTPRADFPPEARIASLPELEAAARGGSDVDWDAVRRHIGLPTLDPAIASRSGLSAGPASQPVSTP